jgi:hypothetical protein
LSNEKRVFYDYEVRQTMEIGSREIILAENAVKPEPYMVCEREKNGLNNIMGIETYENGVASNDYLEILAEYTCRITDEVEKLKAERDKLNVPLEVMTKNHCVPNSENADYTGKVIIIKAEYLMAEYRNSINQIVYATHGNGCRPDALGRGVFTKNLLTGESDRFERHEVAGIAEANRLPEWAREKIAELEKCGKTAEKPSLLKALDENKKTVSQHKPTKTAKSKNKNNDIEHD